MASADDNLSPIHAAWAVVRIVYLHYFVELVSVNARIFGHGAIVVMRKNSGITAAYPAYSTLTRH